MIKKCLGCGSRLQSTESTLAGYIPKEKSEKRLCARCFKINHYNTIDLVSVPKNNQEIISIVNKSKAGALFLVDFLNINSETITTFQSIKIPKFLIISKSDIIPNSIKESKIINWLKNEYKIQENIIFLSTKNNKNTNFIEKNSIPFTKIYLLGYTNAGKSTFLNNLLNNKMDNKLNITTSMIPNTTLDFIDIRLNDNLTIIDSPGFTYPNTLYLPDEIDLIKRINPKRFLTPITHQTKNAASISLEDKIIITYNVNNSSTFYISNDIEIKKIYNIEKYQELPSKKIMLPANTDIVIKGIGFINVKNSCEVTILSNFQDLIEVRNSLFAGKE